MCPLNRTITKQVLLHVCKKVKANLVRRNDRRCYGSTGAQENLFIPFDDVLAFRRDQAFRSVIVQVKTEKSYGNLLAYLKQYGTIKNSYFYSPNNVSNYILVEFESVREAEDVLAKGQFTNETEVVPVRSPLLWFRSNAKQSPPVSEEPRLNTEPVTLPKNAELENILKKAENLSDEMTILYNTFRLNELGSRLRFITALQVESALKGLFPFGRCVPFGSSINSFGKVGCDLDLVATFDGRLQHEIEDSRLIHHSKTLVGNNRMHVKRHLEIIADIVQYFLPGCDHVIRILQARVPILRYKQEITAIDCDLSTTNMSGVYMSELLYMLGAYDSRVCPLVFAVRYWAKEIGLTNPSPGRWITNFSLTLLVLFYLQHRNLVPTLNTLIQHQRPVIDVRSFDDVDCTFLRDINLLPKNVTARDEATLAELLFDLFSFYSSFDFNRCAISLHSGKIIPKPEYSALYIVNPLEKHLNVSRNVSPDECERIRMQFRTAAWNMECLMDEATTGKLTLLGLIKRQVLHRGGVPKRPSMKTSKKFTVQELFGGDFSEDSAEEAEARRLPHEKTN